MPPPPSWKIRVSSLKLENPDYCVTALWRVIYSQHLHWCDVWEVPPSTLQGFVILRWCKMGLDYGKGYINYFSWAVQYGGCTTEHARWRSRDKRGHRKFPLKHQNETETNKGPGVLSLGIKVEPGWIFRLPEQRLMWSFTNTSLTPQRYVPSIWNMKPNFQIILYHIEVDVLVIKWVYSGTVVTLFFFYFLGGRSFETVLCNLGKTGTCYVAESQHELPSFLLHCLCWD